MLTSRWYVFGAVLAIGTTLSLVISPLTGNSFLLLASGAAAGAEAIGLAARRKTRHSEKRSTSARGLIIWLGLLTVTWWVRPVVGKVQDDLYVRHCMFNLRQVSSGLRMYANDYDGRLPPSREWSDLATPYVRDRRVFVCPEEAGLPCGYAYNVALHERSVQSIPKPANTVLLFESDRGWNAAGDAALLAAVPRHYRHRPHPSGVDVYAFADGTARRVVRARLGFDDEGNTIWAKESDADWMIWEPVIKEDSESP